MGSLYKRFLENIFDIIIIISSSFLGVNVYLATRVLTVKKMTMTVQVQLALTMVHALMEITATHVNAPKDSRAKTASSVSPSVLLTTLAKMAESVLTKRILLLVFAPKA